MSFKVTTPVATEPVTTAQAKTHLKVDSSTDDDLISALITAAREVAEHFTGRAFAQQTIDLFADEFPSDDERIPLPMLPVASVTHVKYYDTAGTLQTISSGNYALSASGLSHFIAPTYGNYWPTTRDIPDAVQIRYVTGYGATGNTGEYQTCPKAAVQAILLMVGFLYENRGDSLSENDIQPPAAKALLQPLRVYG